MSDKAQIPKKKPRKGPPKGTRPKAAAMTPGDFVNDRCEKAGKLCGAMTRRGLPCRAPAMANGRCRMHGGTRGRYGMSAKRRRELKENPPSVQHGIYASLLTEEERNIMAEADPGRVDDEIRLVKIRIRRAMQVQAAVNKAPVAVTNDAGMMIGEIHQEKSRRVDEMGRTSKAERTNVIRKRADLDATIDRLLGRLAVLEKVRVDIMAIQQERENNPDGPRIIAERAGEMMETLGIEGI